MTDFLGLEKRETRATRPINELAWELMAWSVPLYSRTQVDKAGKAITGLDYFAKRVLGISEGGRETLEIVNNWRVSHSLPSPETYSAELWIKQSGFRPLLIGNRVGPLSCVRTGAVGSDNSVRSTLLLCRHTVDRTSTSDRRVGRVDGPWR